MRCLVVGAGGFIGGHLTEWLQQQRCEVWALTHRPSPMLDRLNGTVEIRVGDVLDEAGMVELIREGQPEAVFHLAAQSFPTVSWTAPAETFRINVLGTLNVLEAVRRAGVRPVIVSCGSSAEYGPNPEGAPIAETHPTIPTSPYGISKLAQDHLARLYAQTYELPVIRARPFFLIGPRKTGDVCSDFAQRLIALERSGGRDFPVGNLEAVRDFLDIRDGACALWTLAQRGRPGEVYNICSGKGVAIRQMLGLMKSRLRVSINERLDPGRLRPADDPVRIGDPHKLMALGWVPQYTLEQTIEELLSYWRSVGELARTSG